MAGGIDILLSGSTAIRRLLVAVWMIGATIFPLVRRRIRGPLVFQVRGDRHGSVAYQTHDFCSWVACRLAPAWTHQARRLVKLKWRLDEFPVRDTEV